MPETSDQFEPGNVLIRRADRDSGEGQQRLPMPLITPDPSNGLVQHLRRVRVAVAAVIGLTDLITPQKRPIGASPK